MSRRLPERRSWKTRVVALAGAVAVVSAMLTIAGPSPAAAAAPLVNIGPNLTLDEGEGFAIFPDVSDTDGTIVSYAWDLGDGRTSTDEFVSTFYADEGVYTLSLTITDDDGESSSDSVTVTVSNLPPEIEFDPIASRISPLTSREFEAQGFDPGDDTLTFTWTFGDGESATGRSVSHAWTTPGTYTITAGVSDGDGGSAATSATIRVEALTADAGADRTVDEGQSINLGGTGTSDEDAFTSFAWDFGDGETSTDRIAEHAYADEGTYTATLTATDDGGSTTDQAVITVRNVAPTISGISSSGQAQPDEAMSFKVFAIDPGRQDQLSATWDFGDGTTGSGIAVNHTYASTGVFPVEVTVTDGDTGSATATRDITVGTGPTGVPDSDGRDFWLAFDANSLIDDTTQLTLYITGHDATQGMVEIPGIGFSAPFDVAANAVTQVRVPTTAMLGMAETDRVEPRAIHVTSADDVVVYGLNHTEFTSDGYLAQPVDTAGRRYRVMSYGTTFGGSELSVVPNQNNTNVTITPSTNTQNHPQGVPFTVSLDLGDAYELQTSEGGDLTGTTVAADAPISVFGGHRCADVPSTASFCDHLVEQLPPVSSWGQHFVTAPLAGRTQDTIRVLADADDTAISIASSEGTEELTLDAGEIHEFLSGVPLTIDADQGVLVAQYSNGSSFDDTISDPFMAIVPPFEQYFTSYVVASPSTGFRDNFTNVVIPTTAVGSLRVDGAPVPAGQFTAIPGSAYSGASVRVAPGTHRLSADAPFGVMVYGFDVDDSYGYAGGAGSGSIATIDQTAVSPPTQSAVVGDLACVDLEVSDADGDGLPGIRVDLAVSGAHPATSSVTTGTAGTAPFCYSADTPGLDSIDAVAADEHGNAEVTWQIADSNEAPTADDQDVVLDEDTSADVQLTGTDPEGSPLSFQVIEGPSHGVLMGSAPDLLYVPDTNFNGTDQLTFVASDGDRLSALATVALTVRAVNDPPTLIDPGSFTVSAGSLVSVPVTATDPDGTSPTITLESGPDGLSLVDSVVTWQTGAGDAPGVYPVSLHADDGEGGTADVTFTITVERVAGGPTVELSTEATSVQYSDAIPPVDIVVRDTDLPQPDLSLAVSGLPAGLTASPLTYDPDASVWRSAITGRVGDIAATYPVDVTVSDANGLAASDSLNVTVLPEDVSLTLDADTFVAGPGDAAAERVPVAIRVVESVDGALSADVPGSSGVIDAAPVTVDATAPDDTTYSCSVDELQADTAVAASGECDLLGLPIGVYEVSFRVGNQRFQGVGTSLLTVRPAATTSRGVFARGSVVTTAPRSIRFGASAIIDPSGALVGGLILRNGGGPGWFVRSTAITDLQTGRLGGGRRSGEITASGVLFTGEPGRGHHGHWHHGHWHHDHHQWPHHRHHGHHQWPHGPWPPRHPGHAGHAGHAGPTAYPTGGSPTSGQTSSRPLKSHRWHHGHSPWHHGQGHHHGRADEGDQQAVTVRMYVEDHGWGRPSPDQIWIGVYNAAGNLMPDFSSPGSPPGAAAPLRWGWIRVFNR